MKDLSKKVVMVTGCTGGIGRAVCKTLALHNAGVIGISRNADLLLEETLRKYNDKSCCLQYDLSSFESCSELMSNVINNFYKIDILINCTGTIIPGLYKDLGKQEIDSVIENNLYSIIYPVKAALPYMIRQGYGKIITIGSLGGIIPMPYEAVYASAKFAVRGFSLSLAKELKVKGIDVSLISAGPVKTPMLDKESRDDNSVISFIQKPLQPGEIAEVVLSLIKRPELEIIVPKNFTLLSVVTGLFPKLFYRVYSLFRNTGRKRLKLYREKYLEYKTG